MFLYLTKDALQMNKQGGTIVITDNETKVTRTIPFNNIEGVVIFGRIQLTTDVITSFLKAKTPVFFLSKNGSYFGKLDSLEIKNIEFLYRHIGASMDQEISLEYAKRLIQSKINNSIVMLQRWEKKGYGDIQDLGGYREKLRLLRVAISNIRHATSKESLRGYEGHASKIYFELFAQFLKEPFSFTTRSRRPPLDPVNAMMSLGYTFLAQTIQMVLSVQGIEGQLGFFHQPKDLRSLLVLDMMEMYRAWIVDDLVVRLTQKEVMKAEHFFINTSDEKRPVLLTDEGLKKFIDEYYKCVFSKSDEENFGNYKKLSLIEKDIEAFKQSIIKNDYTSYEGFKIK